MCEEGTGKGSIVISTRSTVVLPEPDSPTIPSVSPARTVSVAAVVILPHRGAGLAEASAARRSRGRRSPATAPDADAGAGAGIAWISRANIVAGRPEGGARLEVMSS